MPKLEFTKISKHSIGIFDSKQPKFKGYIEYKQEFAEWLLSASCPSNWYYTADDLKQITAFMETL